MDCLIASPLLSVVLLGENLEAISGGGGWVGAGLLGAVLSWLLFVHLPRKDKQLEDFNKGKDELLKSLITDCDKHNSEIVHSFNNTLIEQRKDFQESLKFIAQQNERYIGSITDSLRQEMKNLTVRGLENLTIVPPKQGAKDANSFGS